MACIILSNVEHDQAHIEHDQPNIDYIIPVGAGIALQGQITRE